MSVAIFCKKKPDTDGCTKPEPQTGPPQALACASLIAQAKSIAARLNGAEASYQAALAQSKTACSRAPAMFKAQCEASQKRKVASLKMAADKITAQNNQLTACRAEPPAPPAETTTPEPETTTPGDSAETTTPEPETTTPEVEDVVSCRSTADCTGDSRCFFGKCKATTKPPVNPPTMCCKAMTARCNACAARQTVEVYCADKPTALGCAKPQTDDAECSAIKKCKEGSKCFAGKCKGMPTITFGPKPPTNATTGGVARCRTTADCTDGSKCFAGTCKAMPTFKPQDATECSATKECKQGSKCFAGTCKAMPTITFGPKPPTNATAAGLGCPAASVTMCAARNRDCKFEMRGGKMRPTCVVKPKPATPAAPALTTCPTASVAMCAARKRDCKFEMRGGKMRPTCVAKPKPVLTQQQIECKKFAAQAKSIAARLKGAQASYKAALAQSKTACSRFAGKATSKAKCEASQKRKVASLETKVDKITAQNNQLKSDLGKC